MCYNGADVSQTKKCVLLQQEVFACGVASIELGVADAENVQLSRCTSAMYVSQVNENNSAQILTLLIRILFFLC